MELFTAALSCPKFLKPSVALFKSVPAGRMLCSFAR
jgi:hypothetical protein